MFRIERPFTRSHLDHLPPPPRRSFLYTQHGFACPDCGDNSFVRVGRIPERHQMH